MFRSMLNLVTNDGARSYNHVAQLSTFVHIHRSPEPVTVSAWNQFA